MTARPAPPPAAGCGGDAAISIAQRHSAHFRESGNPGPQMGALGPRFRGDERKRVSSDNRATETLPEKWGLAFFRRLSSVLCRPKRRFPMDATALRAMQAPLKERYKGDPKSAYITLKAKGTLDDAHIACKVETGRALAVAGLHPATGGSGIELCSGDMLLEALVACGGVTLKAGATALDVPLKSGKVSAEGDLDFRGTLGVAKDAPVGFAAIRLRFDVETDAPPDKLDALLKLTERYCVVYQTLKSGPPIEVKLNRA